MKKRINISKSKCEICKIEAREIGYGEIHEHHIKGREIKKANYKFNKVALCPLCHNKVHKNELVIHGWKMTSVGLCLIWEEVIV